MGSASGYLAHMPISLRFPGSWGSIVPPATGEPQPLSNHSGVNKHSFRLPRELPKKSKLRVGPAVNFWLAKAIPSPKTILLAKKVLASSILEPQASVGPCPAFTRFRRASSGFEVCVPAAGR